MQTRHTLLSKFSKEDIYEYYVRQQQGESDRGMIGPFRGLLPLYTYHRDLPDSIVLRVPGRKTRRDFELSRFYSATTVNRYIGRYEFLRVEEMYLISSINHRIELLSRWMRRATSSGRR